MGKTTPMLRVPIIVAVAAVALSVATAVPPLASAQSGTPAAATPPTTASASAGDLATMLRLAPDMLGGNPRAESQIATYADIEAQLAALGIMAPSGPGDQTSIALWVRATRSLLLPSPIAEYALTPRWRQTFGFNLYQVDQALQVGAPPTVITFLRGRFDHNELVAAWTKVGYKPINAGGATVYSLHSDARVDFQSPVGQMALATMNNLSFLVDGTLVAAATLVNVRSVLDVAAGRAPSLARRVDVSSVLAATGSPLASAVLGAGSLVRGNPGGAVLAPGAGASPSAGAGGIATALAGLAQMPPVAMVLVAVTPGGPLPPAAAGGTPAAIPSAGAVVPGARDEITLLVNSPAAAARAVPVIEERLATGRSAATGQPFASFFARTAVRAVAGAPVIRVELEPATGTPPRVVFDMLLRRDLGFVAW